MGENGDTIPLPNTPTLIVQAPEEGCWGADAAVVCVPVTVAEAHKLHPAIIFVT